MKAASKKSGKKAASKKTLSERACREHIATYDAPGIVEVSNEALLPTRHGTFKTRAFKDKDGREHLAVYKGDLGQEKVPVRIHSSCTTGDCFHSLRCDCGEQLEKALEYVDNHGAGAVVYMVQEGRGIGLLNKINAYVLQEKGLDTVEANVRLGFGSDIRDYAEASEILRMLGVKSVLLMTNNPLKIKDLRCHGTRVAGRIPLKTKPNKFNRRYLMTKKMRMDQLL